ncbi:ceramidase [Aureococcus anophagefferens]|nr:ceramidase [Aureococcus anophagefferens]
MKLLSVLFAASCAARAGAERTQEAHKLKPGAADASLLVGTATRDCTGPSTEYLFMGMANPSQHGQGLWTRQFARAFVFVGDGGSRAAFVSVDNAMIGHVLKSRVLAKVGDALGDNATYTYENVVLSGTHTHSAASGFLQHLRNASASRSPSAYLLNPADERAAAYDGDVDTDFTLLRIDDAATGDLRAVATWFAVHPTSMNNTNGLVSSDNKGLASVLLERVLNPGAAPGRGAVPAAFCSANLGDATPNIVGAFCRDTGEPCDVDTSTCPGASPWPWSNATLMRNEQCSSVGPGRDMFDSCAIIAGRQVDEAAALLAGDEFADLSSRIRVAHAFVEMPGRAVVDWETGAPLGKLCDAAMGQSFAAGTIDGPGQFDFSQNSTSPNPLWKLAARVLHKSTPAQAACQAPKTILIPTGSMSTPHAWAPSVLPVQLLDLGGLVVAAVPTEMTAMAGRRVKRMLRAKFGENAAVVVAGLSNEYADYTATFEEYQAQRYEGGSTIYGPHQLDAYLAILADLADAVLGGDPVDPGPMPADFSADIWAWGEKQPSEETPPDGANFGDQLAASWDAAARNLTASFVGGDLKHDLKHGGTYLEVQRAAGDGWATVFVDGDPETRIRLAVVKHGFLDRHHYLNATMPRSSRTGTYRVLYHGNAYVDGKVVAFTGTSANATVV